jgi:hypothetical protein
VGGGLGCVAAARASARRGGAARAIYSREGKRAGGEARKVSAQQRQLSSQSVTTQTDQRQVPRRRAAARPLQWRGWFRAFRVLRPDGGGGSRCCSGLTVLGVLQLPVGGNAGGRRGLPPFTNARLSRSYSPVPVPMADAPVRHRQSYVYSACGLLHVVRVLNSTRAMQVTATFICPEADPGS